MKRSSHKELADYLKCVIYDLYVLATAVETIAEAKSHELAEVGKTAALVKLRTVYDCFASSKRDGDMGILFHSSLVICLLSPSWLIGARGDSSQLRLWTKALDFLFV